MKIGQLAGGYWRAKDAAGNWVAVVCSYPSPGKTHEYWAVTTASGLTLPFDPDDCTFSKIPTAGPATFDPVKLHDYAKTELGTSNFAQWEVNTSYKTI
jgi:hypothetical protein